MQQYFITAELSVGKVFLLPKEAANHQLVVLRSGEGQKFRLADGKGNVFLASLLLDQDQVKAVVEEKLDIESEMKTRVTIVQGLIRSEKWDYFLQKATESGAARIVPLMMDRCVVKFNPKEDMKKIIRWNKIVSEAAEQSGRCIAPEVTEPIKISQINSFLSTVNFVAYEKSDAKSFLLKNLLTETDSITLVIGCEGGFTTQEIDQLNESGFTDCSLGKRIYRAETASVVALTTIECCLE